MSAAAVTAIVFVVARPVSRLSDAISFTNEPWIDSFIATTLDVITGLIVSLGLFRWTHGHLPRRPRIRTLLVLSIGGLIWTAATSGFLLGSTENPYNIAVIDSTSTDEMFAASTACHGSDDPCGIGDSFEEEVLEPGVVEATGMWIFRNLATASNAIAAFVMPEQDPDAIVSTLSSLSLGGLIVLVSLFGLFTTRSQSRYRRILLLINVGAVMAFVVVARLIDIRLVDALALRAGVTLWLTLVIAGVTSFFLTALVVYAIIPVVIVTAAIIGAWLFFGSLPTFPDRPTIDRGSASHYTSDGREKRGYPTEWEAREEAQRLEAYDGAQMNAYQCGESWCNEWHVGHSK